MPRCRRLRAARQAPTPHRAKGEPPQRAPRSARRLAASPRRAAVRARDVGQGRADGEREEQECGGAADHGGAGVARGQGAPARGLLQAAQAGAPPRRQALAPTCDLAWVRVARGRPPHPPHPLAAQVITDQHELDEYRLRERKTFEDNVRRVGRFSLGIWVKYATWEEKQLDLRRARNVWERALAVNQQHLTFWLKYAEMEMRHAMVNHARNVFERATNILPRVDQLWYKWAHLEQSLNAIGSARPRSRPRTVWLRSARVLAAAALQFTRFGPLLLAACLMPWTIGACVSGT